MNKPIYVAHTSGRTHRLITAFIVLVLVGWAFSASAQSVTNLYSFVGNSSDGGDSQSALVQGSDGNFYGTATGVYFPLGTNNYGTVFRISPSGSFTNLCSFKSSNGAYPFAAVLQGRDGNFYGTTEAGGTSNRGTVFRINPTSGLTNLYSFGVSSGDGKSPLAPLVQGSDGNFYGVTHGGGSSTNCGSSGCGTVFRISPSGNETKLYSFVGPPSDGANPNIAGLVQGSDGNFYGTTSFGGTYNGGIVFRITPNGNCTNLHSFGSSTTDATEPEGTLVQSSDGNFYGMTIGGGGHFPGGYGTVFRISPSGNYTNLYSFIGPPSDGRNPDDGLMQGSDGNFYGTTQSGGTSDHGTIFRISPSGSYTNLHSFGSFAGDGIEPDAGLIQGSDGYFYGTTASGGINNSGTVYRLSIPLNPPPYPINQITGIQLSGTNFVFTIPSIAYETYQLQFTSSMNPTNWVNVPTVSVTNSIGALLTLTNFGGALQPQGFYRFDITP